MSKGKEIKPHIGIFGRRNNGKSSLINVLADQEVAIVSEVPGTTTDPVRKSIEIFGIGPAILVDTAGIDDVGELGKKRIDKTIQALKTVDLGILVIADNEFGKPEEEIIKDFNFYEIPFFVVHNKSDLKQLNSEIRSSIEKQFKTKAIDFSATSRQNLNEVVDAIQDLMPETAYQSKTIIGDIVSKNDVVLLVTPIDTEAPEGRMILPQVQLIRDVLDNDCIVVCLKEKQLADYIIKMHPKPKLVITDSQVFELVDKLIPKDIWLTSFSTVLARHKGDFENYIKGTPHLSKLKDGDKVLILESCTHQVTCDDIGRVKIPKWLTKFSGKKLDFEVVPGLSKIPRDIKQYAMVIQCGGCVVTRKQIISRLKDAVKVDVPVTNYGLAIAYMHGIFDRAIEPFKNSKNA